MAKEILNYLPTVMFRGTPCTFICVYRTSLQLQIDDYKEIRWKINSSWLF